MLAKWIFLEKKQHNVNLFNPESRKR